MTKRKRREHPRVFISYSHKDEKWKDRFVEQLGVLEKEKLLEVWEDRQIGAGDDWKERIQEALDSCDIAVLLISASFLGSNFILKEEVEKLLRRRKEEGVWVIPLIIKPCPWQEVMWLSRMQAWPKDGKALSTMAEHEADELMAKLATEIMRKVKEDRRAGKERGTESGSGGSENKGKHGQSGDSSEEGKGKRQVHLKVAHVEEITSQLRKKGRQKKAHKCHNDEKEKRECKVQKHSVGLAFEVRDFDFETKKTLKLLEVLLEIELKSDEIENSRGYNRVKYKLNASIRTFFEIVDVKTEEYFRSWSKENDDILLKNLIEISAEKLPIPKPIKESSDWKPEDLSIFITDIACNKLQRNIGTLEEQNYDLRDNVLKIKTDATILRGSILDNLQYYLNENVELVKNSIIDFSHPFKEPPQSQPPPTNLEPPVSIQEFQQSQKPKDGSKQEEKSK